MRDQTELLELTLESLTELDNGRAEKMFREKLDVVKQDLLKRPGDDRPRRLVFEVSMKPIAAVEEGGTPYCRAVRTTFKVQPKLPPEETLPVTVGIKATGHMYFSPADPDNPDQRGLPFGEEAEVQEPTG
jgi:hypothetical protein